MLQLSDITTSFGYLKANPFVNLYNAFFADNNWKLYVEGIGNTLLMTLMALFIGVFIGVVVALIKYFFKPYGEAIKEIKTEGANSGNLIQLIPLRPLADLFTTIIRGTPVVLQLLVMYYIIFALAPRESKVFIAGLSFGINSAAYVAEIIRGGILAIDKGQMEAGRSLGLSQWRTMRLIILPQAVKNILPSLFNEFIALVKETSVAGYISLVDITFAGNSIRARDFSKEPLIITALIYLIIVVGLTQVQKLMERGLTNNASSK